MQRRDANIDFDDVIEMLKSNDPLYDELILKEIRINPLLMSWSEEIDRDVYHVTDQDMLRLASALQNNSTLKSIVINVGDRVCSVEWTEVGAEAVGKALKNHPRLNSIYISLKSYTIGEEAIAGLLHSLTGTAQIKTLKIDVFCDHRNFMNKLGLALQQCNSLEAIYIEGSRFSADKNTKDVCFQLFAHGLANQKQLKTLSLNYLPVNDTGMTVIALSLVDIHSLQVLNLKQCFITGECAPFLCSILASNPYLHSLNLNNNALGQEGLQQVANHLPSLPRLTCLELARTKLNNEALSYLISIWLENCLTIRELNISSIVIDDVSVDLILKLIDGNQALKHLALNFCSVNDAQIIKMAPILSDPTRCQLESFDTLGNTLEFNPETCRISLNILHQNKNICSLLFFPTDSEHLKARDINRKKKNTQYRASQQLFVNTIIELCKIYYIPADENMSSLWMLPTEVLQLIMLEVGEGTLGAETEDIRRCSDLILENLRMRRELIGQKIYDPASDVPKTGDSPSGKGIWKWWSQSTIYNEAKLTIFQHQSDPIITSPTQNKKHPCRIM